MPTPLHPQAGKGRPLPAPTLTTGGAHALSGGPAAPVASAIVETGASGLTEAAIAAAASRKAAPWRGRKRVADARSKFVAVRCTPAQHAAYSAAAARAGLSVGAYLRTLAEGSPGPRAVRRPPVEKELLARLLGQIGKLGSNVNQLTHAAHVAGLALTSHELRQIGDEVRDMRAAVMKALGRGD